MGLNYVKLGLKRKRIITSYNKKRDNSSLPVFVPRVFDETFALKSSSLVSMAKLTL